jgi:hypothetical protein
MAKKKELTSEEKVMDLMTKIKLIYKKDLYIRNNIHVFAGSKSDEDVCGIFLCTLEPDYMLAVKDFLGEHDLIFIDDVAEFKKDWETHTKFMTKDDSQYHALDVVYNRVMDRMDSGEEWKSFSTNAADLLDSLFSDNTYVDFKDGEDVPSVTLGKKLFPSVTIKNVQNLFYYIKRLEEKDLNIMVLDFHSTYFRLGIVYYYISLNEEDLEED